MSKIVDMVTALAKPAAGKHGCELWDVEYVKEAGGWFLRVYIDRADGGATINDCEAVSRELDPLLDERESMFPDGYTFEVSSAGAERHLRRPSDFERFMGHYVEVKLYSAKNGRKKYLGNLTGFRDGHVEIELAGETLKFEKSEIAGVRLRIS